MQKTESRIRKQDLLVQLINSLNSNEKRYFKLFNALQSGSKKYAQLFDALTGATHYDADALSDKLHISKKQLADDKKYLENVLLKTLRNFDSADTSRLYNRLMEANLLNSRGLFVHALAIAGEVIKEAAACEYFALWLPAINTRNVSLLMLNRPVDAKAMQQELDKVTGCISEYNGLLSISYQLQYYRRSGMLPERQPGIEKHPIFRAKPEKLKSVRAKVMWYQIHYDYMAGVVGDKKKVSQIGKKMLRLYESSATAMQLMADGYFLLLDDLKNYEAWAGNYQQAFNYINKMEKQATNPSNTGLLKYFGDLYKLIAINGRGWVYTHLKDFKSAEAEFEKTFPVIHKIPSGAQQGVLFHYVLALFHNKKYHRSLDVINTLLAQNYKEPIIYVHLLCRFLMLLNHVCLQHYSLLPYHISSTKSWMKRNKATHADANELLNLISFFEKDKSKNKELAWKQLSGAITANKLPVAETEVELKHWLKNLK